MPLSDEAKRRLARFPVTDLAHALGRNPTAREAYLKRFLEPVEARIPSYAALRNAFGGIYGVERPLDPSPRLTWPEIERSLRAAASPFDVDRCVEAGKCLFDFIRPKGYQAFYHEPQLLRVQTGRYVPIGIDFYAIEGDRLLFHFVNPRRDAIPAGGLTALVSIVHHAYVSGDYGAAEVAVVELSPTEGRVRAPRIVDIPRDALLTREQLAERVAEVYAVLERFAGGTP